MHRLLDELGYIVGCAVATVEVASARIAKKRDAAFGVHHAESEGWTHTSLPPFIFAFDHQSRYAVDVSMASPFHIGCSKATKIGAWSVAVEGYDAECAVGIPCCKVPWKSCLCRVSQWDDWGFGNLGMSALVGKTRHQRLEYLLSARCRVPIVVEGRCHPNHCHAQLLHLCLEALVLIDSLLGHVLLRQKHGVHLLAALGHPQISHRSLAGFV